MDSHSEKYCPIDNNGETPINIKVNATNGAIVKCFVIIPHEQPERDSDSLRRYATWIEQCVAETSMEQTGVVRCKGLPIKTDILDHVDNMNAIIERSEAILGVTANELLTDTPRAMDGNKVACLIEQVEENMKSLRVEINRIWENAKG